MAPNAGGQPTTGGATLVGAGGAMVATGGTISMGIGGSIAPTGGRQTATGGATVTDLGGVSSTGGKPSTGATTAVGIGGNSTAGGQGPTGGTSTGGVTTSPIGGGRAATGGTTGSGGTTDLVGPNLLTSTSTPCWIGGNPSSTSDDPMGIQGSVYSYSDGSSCTVPNPATATAADYCNAQGYICLAGTMSVDPTYTHWGCGIGLQFYNNGNGILSPLKNQAINCFDISFSGNTGGHTVRIGFPQVADESDGTTSPFKEIAPFTNGWSGRVCFADAHCPTTWVGKNCPSGKGVDPTTTYSIDIQILGATDTASYSMCLTGVTPVETVPAGNCSQIDIDTINQHHLGDNTGSEGTSFTRTFNVACSYTAATLKMSFDAPTGPNFESPPTITVSNNLPPTAHTLTTYASQFMPTPSSNSCWQTNSDGSHDYNCDMAVTIDVSSVLVVGSNTFTIANGRNDDDYLFSNIRIELTNGTPIQ